MRQWIAFLSVASLFISLTPLTLLAETEVDYNYLLGDDELTDMTAMDFETLEAFLTRGSLTDYETEDVNGHEESAAQVIWDSAHAFELNPQFILTMLQKEQSLIEDPDPSQDQLAWAMGYAVCDDCSKSDPLIQKYKGFGNQIYYASKRIRESFLEDLESRGYTENGLGPGIEIEIDDILVVPANNATSVLYAYTPHLQGNENFSLIWDRWFTHTYPSGTLLQDKETGGIWYIQFGRRRAITSRSAYLSRFPTQPVIAVSESVINQYPEGDPISFPNYSLLRSPRGTVYLIVDDIRRGIDSQEAFRAIGFNSDEIVDVTWDDLSVYEEGEPITIASVSPGGSLMQNTTTGGVYFVEEGEKHPIMSKQILEARFDGWTILPQSPEDLETYPTGDYVTFPDGTLVLAEGSPDVFVISEGERRLIPDESTFLAYGWEWPQIITTNERSVLLQPLGEEIPSVLDQSESTIFETAY